VDASFSASVVETADLYSGTVSGTNSDVVLPSDGKPIFFSVYDGTIYSDKCDDTACSTVTTSTVKTDRRGPGSIPSNFDAFLSPAGNVAFVYGQAANDYIVYCKCTDATCSTTTCNTTASTYAGPLYPMAANTIAGGKVAIFFQDANQKYVTCDDPDAVTPCGTMGTVKDLSVYGTDSPLDVIQNTDGFALMLSAEPRLFKCQDAGCTTLSTQQITGLSANVYDGAHLIVGGSTGNIGYILLSLSESTRLYSLTLPSGTASGTQTIAAPSGTYNGGFLTQALAKTTVGYPVIFRRSATYTPAAPALTIYTCEDDNCTNYSTYNSSGTTSDGERGMLSAVLNTATSDIDFQRGLPASDTRYVGVYQIGTMSASGVDIGLTGTRFANGYFGGKVEAGSLVVNGPVPAFGKVVIGAASTDLRLDVNGDFGLRSSTPAAFTGTQNDLSLGRNTFVRLSGSSTPIVTGISANNQNGKILILANVGATAIQINNQDSGSTATNRILTGTGANISLAADAALMFIYDATTARWRKLN
jgi:hypothetical protein